MRLRVKLAAFFSVIALGLTVGILAQSPTNVLNPASDLAGKTLVTAEGNRTITGTWSFSVPVRLNPGTANAPGLVSTSDQTTGWLLTSAAIGGSISGTQRYLLNTTGLTMFGVQLLNSSGNLQIAAFNSGTSASSSTYWRGDGTWANALTSATLVSPTITTSIISPLILNCGIRLSLVSGSPVAADTTGATTIYAAPYSNSGASPGVCAFYDGASTWTTLAFTETSIPLGTITSGLPYDVFCYNNSGTMACEILAWTNGTTRATAIAAQNGVPVKSGATTRRLIGSFYTDSTTTTSDTSVGSASSGRHLSNVYNKERRYVTRIETTDTWNATGTGAWERANNSTANQVQVMIASADHLLDLTCTGAAYNNGASSTVANNIGEDSTTVPIPAAGGIIFTSGLAANNSPQTMTCRATKTPAVGHHAYNWIQFAVAGGTTTYLGDNGLNNNGVGNGLSGWIEN